MSNLSLSLSLSPSPSPSIAPAPHIVLCNIQWAVVVPYKVMESLLSCLSTLSVLVLPCVHVQVAQYKYTHCTCRLQALLVPCLVYLFIRCLSGACTIITSVLHFPVALPCVLVAYLHVIMYTHLNCTSCPFPCFLCVCVCVCVFI